jgi:hypothetical protein
MTHPGASVEARLDALERSRRRYRAGVTLAGLVVAGGVALGQAEPPKELRATRFVLVDDEGAVRAQLGVNKDAAELTLRDGEGNVAATLAADGGGGSALRLRQGAASVDLELNADSKELSKPWASLGMSRDPCAVGLGILPGGHAQLNLSTHRRVRVHLGASSSGPSSAKVLAADGTPLWEVKPK